MSPSDPTDAARPAAFEGFTHLEVWLNSLKLALPENSGSDVPSGLEDVENKHLDVVYVLLGAEKTAGVTS